MKRRKYQYGFDIEENYDPWERGEEFEEEEEIVPVAKPVKEKVLTAADEDFVLIEPDNLEHSTCDVCQQEIADEGYWFCKKCDKVIAQVYTEGRNTEEVRCCICRRRVDNRTCLC